MTEPVAAALRALGVRNVTLSVHDASFPSDPDEDVGRGSPCSRGGRRFAGFVRALGFTGLQLGPDGDATPGEPSPYRTSAFPRSTLSIALAPLVDDGLLDGAALAHAVERRPPAARERVDLAYAERAHAEALRAAYGRRHVVPDAVRDGFERANAGWLERYELFGVLRARHGTDDFRRWDGDATLWRAGAAQSRIAAVRAESTDAIAFFRFVQLLAHLQRTRFADEARRLGLRLFGDLPIGLSRSDEWCHPDLFLESHRMGAPPSRTTPAGQPWGYPVFDPRRYVDDDGRPGPVLRFVAARLARVLEAVDGVRIDHPHGLVCPWVYDARDPDPARAVRDGARLFGSPDRADLAAFAIVRPEQLSPRTSRYADGWVVELDDVQVRRYAVLLDAVVAAVGDPANVACEVLSTMPTPLARVLALHGLGRFRVTQKAVLSDPADVYRSENARAEDWMMVGTHDTRPIWAVVEDWERRGEIAARADYLAWRLASRPEQRESLARSFAADVGRLVHAQFADLFASRAANVMVFFTDLFGLRTPYNVPGTVGPGNWTLRVPPAYPSAYARALRDDRALNLPLALAMALRARTVDDGDLLRGVDAAAAAQRKGCIPAAG